MTDAILITGAAGFIGHHFVQHVLDHTKYDVVALDRFDEFAVVNSFENERIITYDWDLEYALGGLLNKERGVVRYVVSLAAESHVDRSIINPVGFLLNNSLSAAHVLDYSRRCLPQARVLHMSTDEVYGAAAPGQCFHEGDRFRPTNPYAASKAAAEALCPAYANTYKMDICVVRSTNVYGPHQHCEKFIPMAIGQIQRGETVQIHSRDGVAATRMYLHVSDLCRALMLVLENGDSIKRGEDRAGYYNVSGALEYSNLAVALKLAELLGLPLHYELVEDPPNRPRPDMRYSISCDRMRELGWTARVELEPGLRSVVNAAEVAA